MKQRTLSPWPYLLIMPALLIIVCVVFIPVINAVTMSLQSYDLRHPKDIAFIGIGNYLKAFQSKQFLNAVWRTLVWVVFAVGLQFVGGMCLSLLLNRNFRGRALARSLSLIPWCTPGVVIALIWRWIYDGNYGMLNDLLLRLGVITIKIPFLGQLSTAFPSVIATIVWQGIPFFSLMLLAGLQGISGDLYEAAGIDGASAWQRFWRITLPSLKNTIFVTTLLRVIWVANSVDIIANMTEGGPAFSTQTLSVYVYQQAGVLNLGYASAMSIVLTLMLGLVAVLYLRYMFKEA